MWKKPAVLTILNGFGVGGVEKTLLLCLPLLQHSVRMSICCFGFDGRDGCLKREYEKYVDRIYRIPKTRVFLWDALSLAWLMRNAPPDVVHSRFGHTSAGFVLACSILRIPVVVSVHSESPLHNNSVRGRKIGLISMNYLRFHRWVTFMLSDAIVGHSESNLKAMRSDWKRFEQCRVVYNGVSGPMCTIERTQARTRLGLDMESECILHVGSFRPEKNHAGLIDIFERVHRLRPSSLLLLVGTGDLLERSKAIVDRKGLSPYVRFFGAQEDVSPYYSAADVFVFPSTSEGLGNVVIEAQLSLLPVVCSDIASLHEALSPALRRYTFEVGDIPGAASRVVEVLSSGISIDTMREARRYAREHFGVGRMVTGLLNTYRDVMGQRLSRTLDGADGISGLRVV